MNASAHSHRVASTAMKRSRRHSRAVFLKQAVLGFAGVVASLSHPAIAQSAAGSESSPRWKGNIGRRVRRWDIVTIGNLSRNRYWGEGDQKGVRPAICTCTVIQGNGFNLVVDPSLANADQMRAELDRRTGLDLGKFDTVFITHDHGDHWCGLVHFSGAKWLADPAVAAALNKTGKLPKEVEPASDRLFEAIDVLPTPGHTLSHHSLRFDCEGKSVVVAGDAVATRDFWNERRGYYNCVDFDLSTKSMDKIAGLADIVVPGHDNWFLNG
jgi:glyoxylase-like metal-dependent hydrolase (beta-lactamase superfamily II)